MLKRLYKINFLENNIMTGKYDECPVCGCFYDFFVASQFSKEFKCPVCGAERKEDSPEKTAIAFP